MHRWFLTLIAGLMLVVPAWGQMGNAGADEDEAVAVVERLHATLIDVMKHADELGYDGRFKRLEPVVGEVNDMDAISRSAMGRHWESLTDQQRTLFKQTFLKLSVATYAARFDGFSGEHFETVETRTLKRGGVLVRTHLVKSDGQPVHLDYVLHQRDGKWRIVNIIAEGVSDLAIKRSEYDAIMTRDGFDTLIEKIRGKIAGFEKSSKK